jgi:hypothetical protein
VIDRIRQSRSLTDDLKQTLLVNNRRPVLLSTLLLGVAALFTKDEVISAARDSAGHLATVSLDQVLAFIAFEGLEDARDDEGEG